jgi:DNA-directed RNA polymerase specialized sigma24 family protein
MGQATDLVTLVKRIRVGPKSMEAVEELFINYKPVIKKMVRRVFFKTSQLRPCVVTDDIVSSVYARLVANAERVDKKQQVMPSERCTNDRGWLKTLIRNVIFDRARSLPPMPAAHDSGESERAEKNRPRIERLGAESTMGPSDSAAEPLQQVEVRDLVDWAMKRQTPEQKEISFRWMNGENWNEIGPDKLRAEMRRLYNELRELHGNDSEPETP